MQISIVTDSSSFAHTGTIVVPIYSDGELRGVANELDAMLSGALSDAFASGEMAGKLAELTLIHARGRPFQRVLLVGLGAKQKSKLHHLAKLAGAAVRYLGRRGVTAIAIVLPPDSRGHELMSASFLAEGAITGAFDTTIYQAKPERTCAVDSVALLAGDLDVNQLEAGVARGTIIGEAVNFARRLALTPANDMTPSILAEEAQRGAESVGILIDVLDQEQARAEGMGSFLSVAQGSEQPPRFIVMTYEGDPGSNERLALVGKGITFDTGGISLKDPERMEEMKYDMSGGAAVIATMLALGKLKPKLNVIGLVPATENMPSGKATKPGDIVTAMNGTTIEVINTDAEGRLVLADALCYAAKLGATKIIDCATLTGAAVIMFGDAASAAVTNNDSFVKEFLESIKGTGENYWHMPLYDEYGAAMKSDIADLRNFAGRPAGALKASAFLKAFVDDNTPWIHLDIASTAYRDAESAWQAKGPTGTPVRALVTFVEGLGD